MKHGDKVTFKCSDNELSTYGMTFGKDFYLRKGIYFVKHEPSDTGEMWSVVAIEDGANYKVPNRIVSPLRKTKTVYVVSYRDAYDKVRVEMFKNRPALIDDEVCIDYKEVKIEVE